MADLLQSGIAWLSGELQAFAAEEVVYQRGNQSIVCLATFGKTLLKLDDGAGGVRMEWTDKDFLIPASSLINGGIPDDPRRGDTIVATNDMGMYTYEVIPYMSEPPWRWSDPYRTIYRIHTKLVGQL